MELLSTRMICEYYVNPHFHQLSPEENTYIGFNAIVDCDTASRHLLHLHLHLRSLCNKSQYVFGYLFSETNFLNIFPVTIRYKNGTFGPTYGNIYCFYCNQIWKGPFPDIVIWTAKLSIENDTTIIKESENDENTKLDLLYSTDGEKGERALRNKHIKIAVVSLHPPKGFLSSFPKTGPRHRMPCFPQKPLAKSDCEGEFFEILISSNIVCLGNSSAKMYRNEEFWLCNSLEKLKYPNCHSTFPTDEEAIEIMTGMKTETSSKGSGGEFGFDRDIADEAPLSVIMNINEYAVRIEAITQCSEEDLVAQAMGEEQCRSVRGISTNQSLDEMKTPDDMNQGPLNWLSKAGLGISLLFLTLTLVLFGLFFQESQVIHNLKPHFHLVIALLGYNLSFHLRTKFGAIQCKIAAMLLHFFLLASFFWTSCIAIRVFSGFRQLRRQLAPQQPAHSAHPRRRRATLAVSILCWAVPFIFCGVCVTLDTVNPGTIGYGAENSSCWIGRRSSHMMVFAIPSFVSLFLNISILILSLVMMKSLQSDLLRSPSSPAADSSASSSNNVQFLNQREMAFAALRLIASVGAQWIFGFALYIAKNRVTEMLFIITTSLQGFFVSISILTTRSVRVRMRRWLTRISRWMSPSKSTSSVVAIAIPATAQVGEAVDGVDAIRVAEKDDYAEVVEGIEKAQTTSTV